MTTNPILVLISMNTLCPEVEDYWLPIPPTVKTIDDLKRHILITESIDRSADDIGLYLESALLRDYISIAGIKNRDYIEMRVKCWISSLADNTSDHERCKSSDTECITIDDSDDDLVDNGSDVSALKRTQSLSNNSSAKTTEELIDEIKRYHIFDPLINSQSQASGHLNPSVDSSTSLANNYSPVESTQEVTELESQTSRDSPYSPSSPICPTGADESTDKDMYHSYWSTAYCETVYDLPSQPNTSTPLAAYRGDKVVTQSGNERSAKGMDITHDHSYGGTNWTNNKHLVMDYMPTGNPLYGKPIAIDLRSPSYSSTALAANQDMSYGLSSPAVATVGASDGSAQWDEESVALAAYVRGLSSTDNHHDLREQIHALTGEKIRLAEENIHLRSDTLYWEMRCAREGRELTDRVNALTDINLEAYEMRDELAEKVSKMQKLLRYYRQKVVRLTEPYRELNARNDRCRRLERQIRRLLADKVMSAAKLALKSRELTDVSLVKALVINERDHLTARLDCETRRCHELEQQVRELTGCQKDNTPTDISVNEVIAAATSDWPDMGPV